MKNNYFHRVHKLTTTRFWINNPTSEEAMRAIEEGATGCTNNPSFSYKMYQNPALQENVLAIVRAAIKETESNDEAAAIIQRKLTKPIQEIFHPMWLESNKTLGYVSIQGDPVHEHDPQVIINEARENRKLGGNIAIKIPCTKAGLEAMRVLVAEDIPINATEIMSVSQGIDLCELYEEVSRESGKNPPLWLSFIAGIYDDHLANYVRENNVDISPDVLKQAGLAATRKMDQIMRDRGYRAVIIGGGARRLDHFTEMVGGNQVVTINWKGTADKLIEENPIVMDRFHNPVSPLVIDELLTKLPDFRKGYEIGALGIDEYEVFGPVELFKSMFLKSWNSMLDLIADERKKK